MDQLVTTIILWIIFSNQALWLWAVPFTANMVAPPDDRDHQLREGNQILKQCFWKRKQFSCNVQCLKRKHVVALSFASEVALEISIYVSLYCWQKILKTYFHTLYEDFSKDWKEIFSYFSMSAMSYYEIEKTSYLYQ